MKVVPSVNCVEIHRGRIERTYICRPNVKVDRKESCLRRQPAQFVRFRPSFGLLS